ncbi:MAG: hypothetical protein IPG64_27785 [Haliea sp.]|nr:hypothetical protein [Haliea sp.]
MSGSIVSAQLILAKTLRPKIAALAPAGGGVAETLQEFDQRRISPVVPEKARNDHHALRMPGWLQPSQQWRGHCKDCRIRQRARPVTQRQ